MASKLGIKPFENCPNEHLKKAEKIKVRKISLTDLAWAIVK